ncbi:hypothetical protein SAMN06265337_1967 [Hymenobacter gelipurpurascens]|uniref:Uncharacterized protein n=1 Tax=Hymenobacter gelipurpurascens TaxID=89968 RepID=A0A212TND2_9BACT|nr:hypothetical protein [Hymenobacter gelipurpurascens]SNC67483.1 hypothetical protein SAMN06265337_1967 [Hymenobacter gelipurpurascens]
MLTRLLHQAGFFSIQWDASTSDQVAGTTYVRASPREMLRVFVPASGGQIELYAGSLFAGKLRYRGPVRNEAELLRLLDNKYNYIAA